MSAVVGKLSADIDITPEIAAEALRFLSQSAYENSRDHGFAAYGDSVMASGDASAINRLHGNALMLIVGEVAEAHEELRAGHAINETYYMFAGSPVAGRVVYGPTGTPVLTKPEGVPSEIADVVIRCLDLAGHYSFDLGKAVMEKMAYNATRPHLHGKQF